MLDLSLGNWRIWYEMVWVAVYLVPSDTKVTEIYLLKTQKCYMMSSCMTKLEFLPEPDMLLRLWKTFTYMLLAFALSFVKLCDPYERFIMLLKSRSVHTTQICTTPTLGVGAKTCLPSRSTQKCSTPTPWVNPKTCLLGFPSTK